MHPHWSSFHAMNRIGGMVIFSKGKDYAAFQEAIGRMLGLISVIRPCGRPKSDGNAEIFPNHLKLPNICS